MKRYSPMMYEPGVQECADGQFVNLDTYFRLRQDYEVLLKERDMQVASLDKCQKERDELDTRCEAMKSERLMLRAKSSSLDEFKGCYALLEHEGDKLREKLSAARDEILSLREKLRKSIGGQTGSL